MLGGIGLWDAGVEFVAGAAPQKQLQLAALQG